MSLIDTNNNGELTSKPWDNNTNLHQPTSTRTPQGCAPKPPNPAPTHQTSTRNLSKPPAPSPPQSPAYLITPSNAQSTQGSLDLTRSAYSAHDTTDPTVTPMHTMLQYQAYRLPPPASTYMRKESRPTYAARRSQD